MHWIACLIFIPVTDENDTVWQILYNLLYLLKGLAHFMWVRLAINVNMVNTPCFFATIKKEHQILLETLDIEFA